MPTVNATLQEYMKPLAWILAGLLAYGIVAMPRVDEDEVSDRRERDRLPAIPDHGVESYADMIATGFFGAVPRADQAMAPAPGAADETSAAAAVQLRQRIKVIFTEAGSRQVLFDVDGELAVFRQGESLPGTDWRIRQVGADRLVLQDSKGKDYTLALFGTGGFVPLPQSVQAGEEQS